jgi:alkaline phosphatase D
VAHDGSRELTRRSLLAGAGALVAARYTPAFARRPERPLAGGEFAQGVASGLPGLREAALWTRLEGIERSGTLTLEVASDDGFAHVVHRARVRAAALRDFTVHAHVERLRPGEQYFYRFHTRSTESPVGRFRTRRPADSHEPVRVAFFSCQNWQTGYYTAHAGLAREPDLDLVVCVGDYIYEAASDPGPREDTIGPDRSAQTLDEYRAKYRLYRSDKNLQAMHAAFPFAICWDDHEVMSSYYGETPGNAQGRAARVAFAQRRRNGYLAFFEHMPLRRLRGERDRIYRRIPLGANADVFLTDLHQYGAPSPDCSPSPSYGAILLGPCPQAKDPSRSLLGTTQRRWLEDSLVGSRAAWKLWGTSMMLMALDSAPGTPFTIGEWSGWEGERNSLAASLAAKGVRDLAAFSGDIHTFFAGKWTRDGRDTTPAVGVEFVSGSVTSSGIADSFGGQAAFTDQVTLLNPHIAYADTLRRGYAVAEAHPDELRVTFRSPGTVKEPASSVATSASFRVPRGEAVVQRA